MHAGIPPPPPGADPPDQTPPQEQTPPGADPTPQEQTPPRSRHPPGADPPEQTPPRADTPGKQTPPRSRHPREADSRIRSTSGRYAFYWNAFLVFLLLHKHFLFTLYFLCCLHAHFSGAPQKLIYLRHKSCNHLRSSTKQLSVLDIRFLRNVRGPVLYQFLPVQQIFLATTAKVTKQLTNRDHDLHR